MYCPQCSQQQVSDEMRFCCRCGFPLDGVKELIARGGGLAGRETEAKVELSPSQKGMRRGVWVMLVSLVLGLFALLLSAIEEGLMVLMLFPFLSLVVGFVILLYGTFLAKKSTVVKREALQPHFAPAMPLQPGFATRIRELSPQPGAPIEGFTGHRTETAEMVQPSSVTDRTTRLLDEEANSPRD